MAADRSELRLSDAERQEALDALSEHVRTGRLELTEFDERSAGVSAAKFRKDLKPMFADLPEPRPSVLESGPRQDGGMSRTGASGPPVPVQPWRQRLASLALPAAAILAIALFFVTRAGFFVFLIPAAAALLAGMIVNRR
ncbi:DUF1707 domain-containing protein [Prauserella halophila]|uniref:DUF1707 domain-containing protein n=1 Tax=Prauserella halophila TaxID=185641 RepID=A0ABP4H126_9PSEU|nr:DUF1707 domain-containing protein [Prauserella halophila]MCP2238260.1 protein of unknown function (DUF1707) [Prauserella halophila]